MKLPSITDIDLTLQRVLIREDFNVPIVNGNILSDKRITAALPTIEYALQQRAAVILISHLGRPKLNNAATGYSLAPIANCLSQHLNRPVKLIKNWVEGINIQPGEVVLCENVRLQPGEHTNDPILSKKLAALADIVVMDAFAVAHRMAASTVGMVHYAKQACCGLLFESEVRHLTQALNQPKQPIVAVMGGAKIATKLTLLASLIHQADHLILGGGLANTFLSAQGFSIGQSLYEPHLINEAQNLLQLARDQQCQLHLPQDVITQHDQVENKIETKPITAIQANDIISDIGPITVKTYQHCIDQAGTILWNGPMGIFEHDHFQTGTAQIAMAIHNSNAFSIAGGGETVAAIERYHVAPSYTSTAGGAFLAFLENTPLPTIHALQKRMQQT